MKAKLVLLVIAALFISLGCDKNPNDPEEPVAPTLPPAQSMQLDMSAFGTPQSLGKTADPLSQTNFNNAVIRVAIVNTVVAAHLVVPTTIFAAAISEKPVLGTDGKFHWIYQITWGLTTFEADLAGWIDPTKLKINWEMYVTNPLHQPTLDKFLWYDGWASLENQNGQWTFYNPDKPSEKEQVIKIDWAHKSETDASLAFENVWNSHEEKGDILEYLVKDDDRTMAFFDKSENTDWTIYWHAVTSAGYLHVPDYNDGEPAHWDENHNDIDAP